MTKFIAFALSIMLLLFFPLQAGVERINHYKMASTDNIVHGYSQKARIEGRFSESITDAMIRDLRDYLKIPESEIVVEVTTDMRYRTDRFNQTEFIYYKVAIPIERIIAMHQFWGLSGEENQMYYVVEGVVGSERLPDM